MRSRIYTTVGTLLAIMAFAFVANTAQAQDPAVVDSTSLYERLGGIYAIATVVDDFIDRLLVNEVLNANPAIDEARTRVPKAGLKYRVTELVGQVTGGPQTYTGRSMKDTHGHMDITEQQWQAMMADFKATLDHFEVPAQEQEEMIAIMESTKADIVKAEGM